MIETAIIFIRQLSLEQAVSIFWYFFIFDLPRYTLALFSLLLTDIVSAITALFRSKATSVPAMPKDTPISVMLVGHNEGDKLERCVNSIHEQTLTDIEIVVVDDGSSDDMPAVGTRLYNEGRIQRFVATGLRGGKAGALNLGFRQCTRPLLISADIDTTFDRDAFFHIIQPLADPAVGAVSGDLAVRNPDDSILTGFQAMQYLVSISLGRQFLSTMDGLSIVSGAFGSFRRHAIEAVGGWDVGPGDDSNLTAKLRMAGWRIRFAQQAWAMTDAPATFKGFFNQRMRWNRSLIRNRLRKFKSVFHPFQRQFMWRNVLSSANVLFFQVLLAWSFFIYQGWLWALYGESAIFFILVINILYFIEDNLVYMYVVSKFPSAWKLWPFSPFFFVFKGYLLRSIRAIAYLDELIFRRSYRDEFYPRKVREQVPQF